MRNDAGRIIVEAMESDGMTKDDMKLAFEMSDRGHDIMFKFLSEDEDDDSLNVMISWLPIPVEARAEADESLYGHWKDVLNAERKKDGPAAPH